MVMEIADQSDLPRDKLRAALQTIDDAPLLNADDRWLIEFTASYYHHPIGEVVAAALPAGLRHGRPMRESVSALRATEDGCAADLQTMAKRAAKQAELLQLVVAAGSADYALLDERMPGWRRVRKALVDKRLVEIVARSQAASAPLRRESSENGPPLNADQRVALDAVRARDGFRVHLLDGVTGSGKTEVYLQLIKAELAAGRQVLVLVPEIGLTPQLVARFEQRLGTAPELFHSGLSDTKRLAAWRNAYDGQASVLVGTRSAIFLPLAKPGLLIVDEEHDSSLKQQEGLRYSARDLAVVRAKKLDVPIVLGSATPSLETLQRCRDNAYTTSSLPVRAGKAVPPLMRVVDLTRHDAHDGISDPVLNAIRKNIAADGQVLIYLNRRGFAPTLICAGCGRMAECMRCDSRMTVHAGPGLLKCHHCGAERPIDTSCADCGSVCRPLGQGTEKLEETLRQRFPDEPVTRIDSDTTRLKGTMTEALALATAGKTRILVGTQMLSKGHHFPRLTLVVVINADQGLFSTDFRGAEKLAQNLVQVAGRSGREEQQGEVIIQTAFPKHPFWNELFNGGYPRIAAASLAEREKAAWPPFSRLALLRASATSRQDAHQFLAHARNLAEAAQITDVRILGPVSAPMERKAGRYRAQLLLQSRVRTRLHDLLSHLTAALEADKAARRVRWSVDVDPIELF